MSEVTRGEIQDILSKFATSNPEYRKALLRNPKLIVEKQLNTHVPDWLKVKAVEETADTIYVVVPYVPAKGEQLPDGALEMVAGGKGDSSRDSGASSTYTCNDIKGIGTRVEISSSQYIGGQDVRGR